MSHANPGRKHADPNGSSRAQGHNPSWSSWSKTSLRHSNPDLCWISRGCYVCGLCDLRMVCVRDLALFGLGPWEGSCD